MSCEVLYCQILRFIESSYSPSEGSYIAIGFFIAIMILDTRINVNTWSLLYSFYLQCGGAIAPP